MMDAATKRKLLNDAVAARDKYERIEAATRKVMSEALAKVRAARADYDAKAAALLDAMTSPAPVQQPPEEAPQQPQQGAPVDTGN